MNRRIRIICEDAYRESIWCKQLLAGFIKEIKKRRISYEQVFAAERPEDGEQVCVIGITACWMEQVIERCNEAGCVPVVLSSLSERIFFGACHLICPDMYGSVKGLKKALEAAGRNKIALYGANPMVDLDKNRTKVLAELVRDSSDIYSNKDNLENCFRSFYPKAVLYDAVICANGYAAVSLAKRLEKENKQLLDRLVIVAFEEVLKHSKYNQRISLVNLKLESYGTVVMQVLDMIASGGRIAEISVKMETVTGEIPKKKETETLQNTDSAYFEDPEIIYMGRIEQLMQDADDLDHHIIAMLLDGATYTEIADSCYMTEGNIKYRVKKYMTICGCHAKKELLELLKEYLQ